MGVSCSCDDGGEFEWMYYPEDCLTLPLRSVRSKRCISCNVLIRPGESAVHISRFRSPKSVIEERIHGSEVLLADWHLCSHCGPIFQALTSLNVCVDLGPGADSMDECLRQFYGIKPAPHGFQLNVQRLAAEYEASHCAHSIA